MSWIWIEAEDVWFFRDSRSFGRGEDHLARCIFPPFPFTLAGAIRSMLIGGQPHWDQERFNRGEDAALYARVGKPGDLGPHFRIRGPFLARKLSGGEVESYAPLPADVFRVASGQPDLGCFQPARLPDLAANWPGPGLAPLWPPDGRRKDEPGEDLWLSTLALGEYQRGGGFRGEPAGSFFQIEPRIGIARDAYSGTARDQMLYTAPLIRPCEDTGLLAWVNPEAGLPAEGLLALGGEGRGARYHSLADEQVLFFPRVDLSGQTRVRLVLQTPACFAGGWRPPDEDWSCLGLPPGAHLRAAALGRAQVVNGWDIAYMRQKALRTFVPPGSVYYFEWDHPLQNDLDPGTIGFTQSPEAEAYARLGLGEVILGLWDWHSDQER